MANPSLGTATLRTQIDTQGLRSGLQIAQRDVRGFVDTSESRLRQVGRSFAQGFVVAQAAVTAMGGALLIAANRAAQYADEVDKAALRTRLSTDTVQELRFVTDQLGGSFGAVETAVQGLTQRLAGAEAGGDRQAQAFERLGVALRGANGELRSTEELFFDSLGALQGLTNETERAVLAQEVFGRSAAQLGPILSAGAGSVDELRERARELGIVLDGDSIRQLVAYKDQLSELQQQFGGITRELALQFLPILTNGVLPAVQSALEVFRGLPEPLQRAATGFTALGVGAAGAATALRLLGIPIAALFGPAGLIIAGGAAVAVLAGSLIGGRTSLSGAAEEAQRALAGGDQGGFVGALDKLIERSDAGARPALERLRQDLIQTGDVSIEQAARIVAAVSQFQLQNRNIFGFETRGQLELQLTLIGNRAGQDFVAEYEAALNNLDFDRAANVLENAIASAVDTGVRRGDLERLEPVLADLREFIANLANLPSEFRDPGSITGAASTASATGAARAAGTALLGEARTLETVFTELGQAGARSIAISDRLVRAGVSEADARAADLSNRLRLLTGAQSEVLRDFYDEVTDAQLAYLQDRIRDTEAELSALATRSLDVTPTITALRQIPAPEATFTPFTSDDIREARIAQNELRLTNTLAAAAAADAARSTNDFVRSLEDLNRITPIPIPDVGINVTPGRAIPVPQPSIFAPTREQRVETNRLTLETVKAAAALREATRDINNFGQTITGLSQLRPIPVPVPTIGLNLAAPGTVFTPPTPPRPIQDRIDSRVEGNERDTRAARAAEEAAQRTTDAADQFRDRVVLAGAQFATSLAAAIQSGSPSNIFGAVTSGIGSLISIANPLAGTIFSLVGSLVAGFIPGESRAQEEQERVRAAGAAARGASAVEFNVNIQQSLNVQSLTDPASRAAVDGLLARTVDSITSVIERNVIPRIERLEATA